MTTRSSILTARDWAGLCAVILSIGLSIGWCGSILWAAIRGPGIGEAGVQLIATLGGAIAGAVATYLGSMVRYAEPQTDDPARPGGG